MVAKYKLILVANSSHFKCVASVGGGVEAKRVVPRTRLDMHKGESLAVV